MTDRGNGGPIRNWMYDPTAMAQEPGWFEVVCVGCQSRLQVLLRGGITAVQCGNCQCAFAVSVQKPRQGAQPVAKKGQKRKK